MSTNASTPNDQAIVAAVQIYIFDGKGTKITFGDIFKSEKTIIVFIRHFFCGAYVSQLATIKEKSLSDAGVKLVVIGCGDWKLIDNYKKETGFTGEMFADPSRKLYQKLDMTIETLSGAPAGERKRSYVTGALSNALKSIWKGPIMHPQFMGKQGSISQLGGEFIFAPGNICHFSHLMQHTEDHIEVSELMGAAGVKIQ